MIRRPPVLRLYQAATALISPLAPWVLRRRARAGKEDPAACPAAIHASTSGSG